MSKICKIGKASITLLLIALFIISWGNTISYANDVNENTEVSDFFINFINDAYSDIDRLRVRNQDGEDVTDYFINIIEVLFENKDYKAIQEIIINEKLIPSVRTIVASINKNDLSRAIITQHSYERFYHNEPAKDSMRSLEWLTKLSGSITYDPNTGKIYSATNPTLSLEYSGGGWDSPGEMSNISTSKYISTSSVTFTGKYKMTADMVIIDTGGIIHTTTFYFGTHVDSFVAYIE